MMFLDSMGLLFSPSPLLLMVSPAAQLTISVMIRSVTGMMSLFLMVVPPFMVCF